MNTSSELDDLTSSGISPPNMDEHWPLRPGWLPTKQWLWLDPTKLVQLVGFEMRKIRIWMRLSTETRLTSNQLWLDLIKGLDSRQCSRVIDYQKGKDTQLVCQVWAAGFKFHFSWWDSKWGKREARCFCKVCPVLFQRQMEQEILLGEPEGLLTNSNLSSLFFCFSLCDFQLKKMSKVIT